MDSTEPYPTDSALDRLAKLAAAGSGADEITRAVGEIVAGWADEPEMDAATAAARVGLLWDSLSRDAADLEEQISDAPGRDAQALAGARRTLAAMQAAIAALAAVSGRLGG